MEFTTEVEFSRIGNGISQSASGTVKITWKLELDVRDYGIAGIKISVPDQKQIALLTRYDREKDEEIEFSEEIDIKNVVTKAKTVNTLMTQLLNGIKPQELEQYYNNFKLDFY